jgi:uncharacterized membrane protein YphA (DoxX/SURF4 family)
MNRYADLIGRILMSLIFLSAGVNKIVGYSGTQGYMDIPWEFLACCFRWSLHLNLPVVLP